MRSAAEDAPFVKAERRVAPVPALVLEHGILERLALALEHVGPFGLCLLHEMEDGMPWPYFCGGCCLSFVIVAAFYLVFERRTDDDLIILALLVKQRALAQLGLCAPVLLCPPTRARGARRVRLLATRAVVVAVAVAVAAVAEIKDDVALLSSSRRARHDGEPAILASSWFVVLALLLLATSTCCSACSGCTAATFEILLVIVTKVTSDDSLRLIARCRSGERSCCLRSRW